MGKALFEKCGRIDSDCRDVTFLVTIGAIGCYDNAVNLESMRPPHRELRLHHAEHQHGVRACCAVPKNERVKLGWTLMDATFWSEH